MNLERVALLEHQLGSVRSKGSGTSKIFDSLLELLLNSKQGFDAYAKMGRKSTGISRNIDKYGDEGENKGKDYGLGKLTGKTKPDLKPQKIAENAKETNNSAEELPLRGGKDETENMADKEFLILLDIFEARLNNCLKERIKLRSTTKATASTQHKEREDVFKRMFELTLRASLARKSEEISSVEQCDKVLRTITALEKLLNNTDLNH
jgi:hypothetical protein